MKKLLLLIVAVATVSLVSCKKDEAAKTENGEAAQVEQAEEAPEAAALEIPKPTGDVEADVKAVADFALTAMESIEDEASMKKFEELSAQVSEEFEKFYADKPELKAKTEELGMKYMETPEYKERMQKAAAKLQEIAMKAAAEQAKK